ncbi:hypothetical protein ACIPJS_38360 [Streptomyces sp. NPDC086783]|uniref:hypothetical protein n=1 Tax=Streptomyces sp. NPDC086783 TaxID=3365758 RepID=UPI003805863E
MATNTTTKKPAASAAADESTEAVAEPYTGIADSYEVIVREGLVDFAAVYRRGESTPRFAADAAELTREPLALRQAQA